jgi:uncharacterized protein with HEPN domain
MVTPEKKSKQQYCRWILESIGMIEKYTQNISREQFIDSDHQMHRDAVCMQLQLIGELVRQLHIHHP